MANDARYIHAAIIDGPIQYWTMDYLKYPVGNFSLKIRSRYITFLVENWCNQKLEKRILLLITIQF